MFWSPGDHAFCPESGASELPLSAVIRGYYLPLTGPCFSPLVRLHGKFVPCRGLASWPPGSPGIAQALRLGEWWGGVGVLPHHQEARLARVTSVGFPGAARTFVKVHNGCSVGTPRGVPKLVKACPRPTVHGFGEVPAGWSLNPLEILGIRS